MGELIEYLFLIKAVIPQASIQQLWDNRIRPLFTSLSYADFADWLARSGDGQGYLRDMAIADLRRYMACNLQMFNDRVGQWLGKGTKPFICVCYGTTCCRSDEACPNPNLKRLAQGPGLESRENITLERRDKLDSALTRRANDYDWSATWNGVTYTGSYSAIDWPGPSKFAFTDWIWQHVFAQALEDDCTLTFMREYTYQDIVNYVNQHDLGIDEIDFAQVEHWVEKNMMSKFTADVIAQRLPSGKPFRNAAGIPPTFFTSFMTTTQLNLQGVATVPGAQNELVPKKRIMHTLGSNTFTANFMLLQANLNNMKEGILKGDTPVADTTIQYTMTNLPRVFITYLRQVFGVLSYLNDATALDKGEATLRAIRWEWYNYQQQYTPFIGHTIDVVAAWDEWYLDFMQTRMLATRDWLLQWATDGLSHWQGTTDPAGQVVERICALYIDRAHEFEGFNSEGYPTGTPTAPPP